MAKEKSKQTLQEKEEADKKLSQEVVDQMTKLATSGFGLVAALAWNDAIQSFIQQYINPYIKWLPFYKISYAILITVLIVFITYQLSKIANRLQKAN